MNSQPIVVASVQIEKNGKLLLLRQWKIPNQDWCYLAGKLETNEGLEECIRREAFEELGLKLKKVRLTGFQSNPNPFGNHYITFFFKARIDFGDIEIKEPDKIIEFKWFKKTELPENIYYTTKLFIQGDYYKINSKRKTKSND